MSEPRKKRRSRSRWISGLKAGFNSFTSSFNGMSTLFKKMLGIGGPPRRRNRDFDKAGKGHAEFPDADSKSIASLEKATRIRNQEIVRAVRTENRLLRKRGEAGEQFRKEKESENKEVSSGEVINHLARMQQKASLNEHKRNADAPDESAQQS